MLNFDHQCFLILAYAQSGAQEVQANQGKLQGKFSMQSEHHSQKSQGKWKSWEDNSRSLYATLVSGKIKCEDGNSRNY